MLDLDNHSLLDTAPSSITQDNKVQNIIKAVDDCFHDIHAEKLLVLLISRLDELGEQLVDELAWQFHVDFYEIDADIEVKRSMVRQAIAWHRIKGTPAAIEQVVTDAFDTATVEEWYEYGGEPYHFRVKLENSEAEATLDSELIERVGKCINEAKNTRSWIDGIGYTHNLNESIHAGGVQCIFKSYNIFPGKFHIDDIEEVIKYAAAEHIFRTTELRTSS